MSINLLDLFKDAVGDQIAKQASGFLGESTENTTSALGAILPSLMGGLMKKGAEDGGAASILDFMNTNKVDGSILDNLGGLFGGGKSTNGLLEAGSGILDFVFGKNSSMLGNILDLVVGRSGIGKSSSSSLVKMVAPLLMGVVGRYVKNKALDAVGLGKLLSSQGDHLKSAAPAGLLDKLGLGSILGLDGQAKDMAGDTVAAASSLASSAADTAGSAARSAADGAAAVASAGRNGISRFIPWVILAAAAILLWYLMRSCGGQPTDAVSGLVDRTEEMAKAAGEKVGDVADATSDLAANAADKATGTAKAAGEMAGDAVDALANAARSVVDGMASIKLPGGKDLSIKEGSFLDQVHGYLVSAENDATRRFSFDNLTFQTGSANITESSMQQLQNTADLLEAFPKVKIRVEGHTDNTGNANSNLSLSEQRSLAVKRALNELGVSIERLKSAGLGQTKPIATNETEEGRKQNRRVDFFVTEK